MARRKKTAKRPKPKTVLRLSDLEQSKNAVLNSLAAPSSQVSYGHAIDDTSDVRNTVPTNSYNLANERGSSTFDIRHIATSFLSYDLPQWTKFAPRLTKGWQLNSLLSFHGGQPFTVHASGDISGLLETRRAERSSRG